MRAPERLWAAEETRVQRLARSPLRLAEAGYRLGAFLHRKVYDLGIRRRVRLRACVVSIGNLTVGGSGKTPLAGWIAAELRERGHRVAVLSRGVGGVRGSAVNVVSDGEQVLLGPAEVGDEPVWLAACLRGVPVLAGRNRVALGLRAAAMFGAEVILLDDGFQHHRLARDVDLVCVDARRGLGNRHVLPRGPLREPSHALARAHALLWTRAPEGWQPPADAPWRSPGLPEFVVGMVPRQLRPLHGGEPLSCDALRDMQVGMLAAIARPSALRADIQALGARVRDERIFPDHHLYARRDLADLDASYVWVTTAKDAVKIPPGWLGERRILVLEEEVRPREPHRLLKWLLDRVESRSPGA